MNWISVKDELPELIENTPYSEDVLAYCISHGRNSEFGHPNTYPAGEGYISVDAIVKWTDGKEKSFRGDRFHGKVTHWMPLPKPPKDKEGK